ncbi:hypothetical protein [Clostridium coskatii]|uniref:Uncharacterized protein n=1 Tax=Clostridium coskatii TaxID=1705578 RepID=A0A168R7F9_9CLOT|nr:hypothetical protein [Clostridium coskatii]OAA90148.1 hypothetical protein WX73_02112 [Clostridium coskatii]OBR91074.1 hypothetical protein CLCOS_36520 [Clostridium coskatii]
MNKKYATKFPEWTRNNTIYNSCLSDDLDSLFSTILLNQIKGYEVTHFYDFSNIYKAIGYKQTNEVVAVDVDTIYTKCWSNHVVPFNNPDSANLNQVEDIDRYNYCSKFAGSTLLEITSLYDIDISMLSEEAKLVLLSVDSTFLMYNFNKDNCKKILVNVLELPELFELCKKYSNNQAKFYKVQDKYKMKQKIHINDDGMLETSIDLEGLSKLFGMSFILPKNKFQATHTLHIEHLYDVQLDAFIKQLQENHKTIFSAARTRKNYIKLSYI